MTSRVDKVDFAVSTIIYVAQTLRVPVQAREADFAFRGIAYYLCVHYVFHLIHPYVSKAPAYVSGVKINLIIWTGSIPIAFTIPVEVCVAWHIRFVTFFT